MRKLVFGAALAGAAFVGASANAAPVITITSSQLDLAMPAGTGAAIDFDLVSPTAAGFTVAPTSTRFQIAATSDSNGAEPAGDTSNYLSVLGGGNYQMLGANAYTNVSLYWGSIDTYNYLDLLGANGSVLATVTGPMIPSVSNGNQSLGSTNMRVNIFSDTAFYGLKFRSDTNSFEADNIRFQAAVPEPASWAMMVGGFGVMGGALRRRRQTAARATFA